MTDIVIAVLITLVILAPVGFLLAKQGFPGKPETLEGHERESEEDGEGPTGEEYPTGSRPAGPGAERMTDDPPVLTEEEPVERGNWHDDRSF